MVVFHIYVNVYPVYPRALGTVDGFCWWRRSPGPAPRWCCWTKKPKPCRGLGVSSRRGACFQTPPGTPFLKDHGMAYIIIYPCIAMNHLFGANYWGLMLLLLMMSYLTMIFPYSSPWEKTKRVSGLEGIWSIRAARMPEGIANMFAVAKNTHFSGRARGRGYRHGMRLW